MYLVELGNEEYLLDEDTDNLYLYNVNDFLNGDKIRCIFPKNEEQTKETFRNFKFIERFVLDGIIKMSSME